MNKPLELLKEKSKHLKQCINDEYKWEDENEYRHFIMSESMSLIRFIDDYIIEHLQRRIK
tara:strand:+ start:245 stop:424 length:180 start_codon:yes stop_codon:yes gene_type:complete